MTPSGWGTTEQVTECIEFFKLKRLQKHTKSINISQFKHNFISILEMQIYIHTYKHMRQCNLFFNVVVLLLLPLLAVLTHVENHVLFAAVSQRYFNVPIASCLIGTIFPDITQGKSAPKHLPEISEELEKLTVSKIKYSLTR